MKKNLIITSLVMFSIIFGATISTACAGMIRSSPVKIGATATPSEELQLNGQVIPQNQCDSCMEAMNNAADTAREHVIQNLPSNWPFYIGAIADFIGLTLQGIIIGIDSANFNIQISASELLATISQVVNELFGNTVTLLGMIPAFIAGVIGGVLLYLVQKCMELFGEDPIPVGQSLILN